MTPAADAIFPHVNPCDYHDACLSTRAREMQPVANTAVDQRRHIPCASCKQGIERAREEARTRKPTQGGGMRYCADPDCETVLASGTTGLFCRVHSNRLGRWRAKK